MWLIALLILAVIAFFLIKLFKGGVTEQDSGASTARNHRRALTALRSGDMANAPSTDELAVTAAKLRYMLT